MSDKIQAGIDHLYLAEIPELFNGRGWHGKATPTKMEDFKNKKKLEKVLFPHILVPTFAYIKVKKTMDDGTEYEDIITPQTGDRVAVSLDNNRCISDSVGKNYNTPQNEELYDLFTKALEGSKYRLVSAITVCGREHFFLDAKYEESFRSAGRDITPYVGLHRAFGGKSDLSICGHNTATQCWNTVMLYLKEMEASDSAIRVKNTNAIYDRLPLIAMAIERQHGFQSEWLAALEEAAAVDVTQDDARAAFVSMVANERLGTRSVNRANLLLELFNDNNQGNTGENLSDVYNAVTDLYTHHSAGSEDKADEENKENRRIKQWFSSEFGTAATRKQEFTVKLFDLRGKGTSRIKDGVFEEMVEVGNEIISNSDSKLVGALN